MSTQPTGVIPTWTQGERLRKARETAGYEQGEFAELIGVSRGTVSNYERDNGTAKKIVLRAWSMATGVPLAWLETGEAPRPDGDPDGGLRGQRTRRYSKPQPSDPNVRVSRWGGRVA